jgi:outer membrane protein assembly factor BamB
MSDRKLRLLPAVVVATAVVLLRFVLPVVAPEATVFEMPVGVVGMLGGVVGGLLLLIWWLFFSRARWSERIGAPVLMIGAVWLTSRFVHPSISNGMMGMMLPFFSIPVLSVALVLWAIVSRGFTLRSRRIALVVIVLLACSVFTLLRTDGVTGDGQSQLRWRWTESAEQQLLTRSKSEVIPPARRAAAEPASTSSAAPSALPPGGPSVPPPTSTARSEAATPRAAAAAGTWWPGFRGPNRDGVVRGLRIETDWTKTAPAELWRRPIGPGWSSFAVQDDFIYTQEQRGEDEVVSCYRLTTGEPVWKHRDRVRFWESNAGPGPRATPTLHEGRVYTLGATGIVNALDARTGGRIWSRNAATDTDREIPDWGLASSPLVIDDRLVVAAAGHLVAYDLANGTPRWFGPRGGGGYSSPHLANVGGVPQILLMRGTRTSSLDPTTGALLWEDTWDDAVSIIQPAVIPEGDILVAAGDAMGGKGLRRLAIAHGADGWSVRERWTSRGLKPYFNDYVVHKGHAFGFDGSILASVDLADGTRKWKGGRFGHGQLLLLADQDLLLVLSEDGELALIEASPDRFTELARVPALQGKTWNHPAIAGDIVLVRNGEEMAAFRLH